MGWIKKLFGDKPKAVPTGIAIPLKYNGVYVSQIHIQESRESGGIPSNEFLRFSDNGNVLGIEMAFSQGMIDKVVSEFHTFPRHMFSTGRYEVHGETLSFSLKSKAGIVGYTGQIIEGLLRLHVHSRINDYKSDENYWFASVSRPQMDESLSNRKTASELPGNNLSLQLAEEKGMRLQEQAWACSEEGDLVSAIKYFDEALAITLWDYNAYYGRGTIYCRSKNYTIAIADLNRALRLRPDFPAALTERGLAYVESGDISRGIEDYDQAIQIDPSYGLAYANKGSAYALQERWREALPYLEKGLELAPQSVEGYINHCAVCERLGDYAQAINDLKMCLQVHPNGPYTEYIRRQLERLERESMQRNH